MDSLFEKRVTDLKAHTKLKNQSFIKRGLEKENLRVTPDGKLSDRFHPKAFGSKLSHPSITTDYSEALLEFITKPHHDIDNLLGELNGIHQFVYQHLENKENLWVNSMPCFLADEASIAIADYGRSNSGQLKSVYRHGLGCRYGRKMQSIAGIHYNFSLEKNFWSVLKEIDQIDEADQSYQSAMYFNLIRNFQRYAWLVVYLFGSSPAMSTSFLDHNNDKLKKKNDCYYLNHATSMRMSDYGYQNNAQSNLYISYDNLEVYVETLRKAIKSPCEDYQKIGVYKNGIYKQLNSNILQIENEYYSNTRPKRTCLPGERPIRALLRGGVEYVELRCLDVNPFYELGICAEDIYFLDAFLLFCLLQTAPSWKADAVLEAKGNMIKVVLDGRNTEQKLIFSGETITQKELSKQILTSIKRCSYLLAELSGNQNYIDAYLQQEKKVEDANKTPSALVLQHIKKFDFSFIDAMLDLARRHQQYFSKQKTSDASLAEFQQLASKSISEQARIENSDEISFDTYLKQYTEDV